MLHDFWPDYTCDFQVCYRPNQLCTLLIIVEAKGQLLHLLRLICCIMMLHQVVLSLLLTQTPKYWNSDIFTFIARMTQGMEKAEWPFLFQQGCHPPSVWAPYTVKQQVAVSHLLSVFDYSDNFYKSLHNNDVFRWFDKLPRPWSHISWLVCELQLFKTLKVL